MTTESAIGFHLDEYGSKTCQMGATITGAITDVAKLPKVAFPRISGRTDGGETIHAAIPNLVQRLLMRSQNKIEPETSWLELDYKDNTVLRLEYRRLKGVAHAVSKNAARDHFIFLGTLVVGLHQTACQAAQNH
jgi:hypothetical protein